MKTLEQRIAALENKCSDLFAKHGHATFKLTHYKSLCTRIHNLRMELMHRKEPPK